MNSRTHRLALLGAAAATTLSLATAGVAGAATRSQKATGADTVTVIPALTGVGTTVDPQRPRPTRP